MPPRHELVREWLRLAQNDLVSARHLRCAEPPLLRQAAFHMQQAAEKALKSVLLLNGQRPPRTHSLSDLFGLCERWMPGLVNHEPRCEWLSPFAVEFRYPTEGAEISPERADQGLAAVESLLQVIMNKMPPEIRP